MRYAQIDDNGLCIGDSTLLGPVDAPHMIPLGADDPTPLGSIWHDGQWVDPAPPPPALRTRLTRLEFRNRFTSAEKVALYTAAENNVLIRIFLDDVAAASYIELTDAATIGGVQALEAATLLDEGRAAEILAPIEGHSGVVE